MMRERGRTALLGLIMCAALVVLLASITPGHAQDGAPGDVPADAVSAVNGEPIARDTFHARLRLVRWQYLKELDTLYDATGGNLALTRQHVTDRVTGLQDPAQLGDDVLYEMEEERLLWQTGEQLGLLPTDDETRQQEASFFSLWTNVPVEQIAVNAEAQAFITTWYAEATAASGMTQADILQLFEANALRQRLYAYVADKAPTEELAVHTRHILCSFHPDDPSDMTAPTADQRAAAHTCIATAQERLRAGDAFSQVAADLSDDHASAAQGGDVGWTLVSYLAEDYAAAAQDSALETVVGPVETEFGLHLIEVLDREMQTLSADELEASQQGYFRLWIQTLHTDATITRGDDWAAGLPVDPALDTLDPVVLSAVEAVVNNP